MKSGVRKLLSKRFLLYSLLPSTLFVIMLAAVAYASGGGEAEGHGSGKLLDFAWRTVNFVILAAILYKLTAKGIKGFFVGRRESIKNSIEESIAAKEEAQRKYDEYSDRLEKTSGEIEEISEMIKAQGLAEKEKIIEDARRSAEKMKEDAKARIEQEFKRLSNQLRTEAAELSLELAETILKKKVKKADHEVMVKDFIDRMVKLN